MAKVKINKSNINILMEHAKAGYETLYKKEVGGILSGFIKNGDYVIIEVDEYNTPIAARTSWGPNLNNLLKKCGVLEKEYNCECLGFYHSHNETNEKVSAQQSEEDKNCHLESKYNLEIIISISNHKRNWSEKCLHYSDDDNNYTYTICAYYKKEKKIHKAKLVVSRDIA
ncbi:MAG: hypothetical protein ACYCTB_09740 [bacterium]